MYEDALEYVLDAIRMLNEFDAKHNEKFSIQNGINVSLDGDVIGQLVDEIGGVWSFRETPYMPVG